MNIESQIESILLFRNEPVSFKELAKITESSIEDVRLAVDALQKVYANRGIVIVADGEEVSLGTAPANSALVESMQKEELSRELGRAGLETLAVVLYKGPVSRREVDYIRGVNSSYTLRNLLIRGLIKKTDSGEGERSFSYKPTIELLQHLGVSRVEELPGFQEAFSQLEKFVSSSQEAPQDE